MRLHFLQQAENEGLAHIAEWASERPVSLSRTLVYKDEPLPQLDAFDALVVMGGPMSANDDLPWLKRELRFLQNAIEAHMPVLGICLGAQLIARALGTAVTRNPEPEIGWHDIALTEAGRRDAVFADSPATFSVFHWHFDTFALPEGATLLASSEACPHQIFRFSENVLALQCHLEETQESIQHLVNHFQYEMIDGRYVQTVEEIRSRMKRVPEMNRRLTSLLDAHFLRPPG